MVHNEGAGFSHRPQFTGIELRGEEVFSLLYPLMYILKLSV